MIIDIKVPNLGESISEVEIGEWLVAVGEIVGTDEPVVVIESEKAAVEAPAPKGGVLTEILKKPGEIAAIDEVIGRIDTSKQAEVDAVEKTEPSAAAKPEKANEAKVMPAAKRVMTEKNLSADAVQGSGPGGRILKEDAQKASAAKKEAQVAAPRPLKTVPGERKEERMSMSRIRKTIARRLLDATRNMAILTTFNEIDMTEVKNLRARIGEAFLEKHGIKLGFMSFFVKASTAALAEFPSVNARIENDEIVYSRFADIGVAIGGGKGLVVPVLRNAEHLGFEEIERQIADFGARAKANALTLEELEGGTFTISNGGVYGSMMSTPIVNPPQSGILGLHAIKDRAVVVDGEIAVRPMMYVALSYDHRIVDGREAVTFLKTVKEHIENPVKLMLEL
jgi:2-oxoglutarate dehydrogenase E2 component (dihydrolipoamide succinyltransferase)